MIVGIPKETFPGETRVALTPSQVPALKKKGLEILIQAGAGDGSSFPDALYVEKGAAVAASRAELFAAADILLQVRTLGANPEHGRGDLEILRSGQIVIGLAEPFASAEPLKALAEKGAALFSLELIPRITRAQAMDVLSSQANIAGYKAVLIAADAAPRIFPMMMTAAGTLAAAKAFIIGAGVAGLQAIATARRLGAVVQAYDVRPAVKEQVQSLGAKFVEIEIEGAQAEGHGGYARAMDEEFYRRQRELMAKVVSASDVVITTAAVPGKKAPVLVTAEMVRGMAPGSVIVDLAAERGGNCELTRAGETVDENGVTILGPLNLPASVPFHSSQMYSKNITTFLLALIEDGKTKIDLEDEVIRDTLLVMDGKIVNPKVKEALQIG